MTNPLIPLVLRKAGDSVVDFMVAVPAPIWGTAGVIGAALIAGIGVVIGHVLATRRAAMADAGTLALGLVNELQQQVTGLNVRVTTLETERDAYRSWSHELYDYAGTAQTEGHPRPDWPTHLPR